MNTDNCVDEKTLFINQNSFKTIQQFKQYLMHFKHHNNKLK